jgi:hypothetical protein
MPSRSSPVTRACIDRAHNASRDVRSWGSAFRTGTACKHRERLRKVEEVGAQPMRLQFAANLGHHLAEAQQLQSERPLTSPVAASSGLGIRPDLIRRLSTIKPRLVSCWAAGGLYG